VVVAAEVVYFGRTGSAQFRRVFLAALVAYSFGSSDVLRRFGWVVGGFLAIVSLPKATCGLFLEVKYDLRP
jgi:hypothetical protein